MDFLTPKVENLAEVVYFPCETRNASVIKGVCARQDVGTGKMRNKNSQLEQEPLQQKPCDHVPQIEGEGTLRCVDLDGSFLQFP